MAVSEKNIKETFKTIMARCRAERKEKKSITIRELAKKLGKSENYISSIENGREFPSLKTFLAYLDILGFDIEALEQLTIKEDSIDKKPNRSKAKLVDKIYNFNDDQVDFLVEQAKVAEIFNLKAKH